MTKKQKIIVIILGVLTSIAVIATMITIAVMIFDSNNREKAKEYSDYKENTVEYNEILSQSEFIYYVYIYRSDCSGCEKIKQNVCNYIDGYKKSSTYKLYLISSDTCQEKLVEFDEDGSPISNLYVSDVSKLRISAIPTMLMVTNGAVVSAQVGASSIATQLASR